MDPVLWIVLGLLLSLPYCYLLSLIIIHAYFKRKVEYQLYLMQQLERGEEHAGENGQKEEIICTARH